ncbi:hypothetical protein ACKKBG_A03635 [Auxenochlorella protothecoides x Auxenochlorella symbiontica]
MGGTRQALTFFHAGCRIAALTGVARSRGQQRRSALEQACGRRAERALQQRPSLLWRHVWIDVARGQLERSLHDGLV